MSYTKHLIVGGMFAMAIVGVGMAAIPTSVINVRTNDYTGGTIVGTGYTANYRLTGTHNWTSNNVYMLYGIILVADGATLNIQPGTIIRGVNSIRTGSSFRPGMLIVERGGKIYAKGTASAPICMTDEWDNNFPWFGSTGSAVFQDSWWYYTASGSAVTNAAGTSYNYGKLGDHHGAWGGLVLCGKAFVSWDNQTTLGSGNIQVEGTDANLGIQGGGLDDNDSSGEISYLQVRYGGYVLASTKEINGVTFYGVGRGTKVDHIEVYNNIDDCFEWFGGTVNAKYLVAWGAGDDVFDSDAGFRGKNQFLFGVQRDMGGSGVESGASDKGMEIDGFEKENNGATYLYANSLWANVTLVGMQYTSCRYYSGGYVTKNNRNVGLSMRDNATPRIYNSIVMDFGAAATLIENRSGADLSGDLNTTFRFQKAPTAANFPSVTTNAGATAGMDATAVANYLYGDGVMADEQQAAIRGTIFFNCPQGIAFAGTGGSGSSFATAFDWVSTGKGSGPWVSTGLTSYSGFTNDVYNYNQDLTALSDGANMPIKSRLRISRAMTATTSYAVTNIDPRAANAAVYGALPAPDQWLTPVRFCGAFAASNNWAKGWTTIDSLGALADAPGGDVAAGGTVSVPLSSGTTSYITNTVMTTVTNNITTTVTNGVNGIVYAPNGGAPISGTPVTSVAGISLSPVVTYTLATLGTYQLQTTASLSSPVWTVLKTFTVSSAPVTVNLTDITGETPPNAGNSAFFKLIKQ
ncbi:MAG: hypothetical protein WCP12_04120 [bacterium]